MPDISLIPPALLDAVLDTLEEMFKGYGVIISIASDGQATTVSNLDRAEIVKVSQGLIENNEYKIKKETIQ